MRPWNEICLVFDRDFPDLRVDLLRDAVVEVEAQDCYGHPFRRTLRGEAARAFEHELDHLNGILIVDHAALEDLLPEIVATERPHHAERQRAAFARTQLVPPQPVEANEPLLVLYTSGSTGKPKGIVHTVGGYQVGLVRTAERVLGLEPRASASAGAEAPDGSLLGGTAGASHSVIGTLFLVGTPGWITGQSYMLAAALLCRVPSL